MLQFLRSLAPDVIRTIDVDQNHILFRIARYGTVEMLQQVLADNPTWKLSIYHLNDAALPSDNVYMFKYVFEKLKSDGVAVDVVLLLSLAISDGLVAIHEYLLSPAFGMDPNLIAEVSFRVEKVPYKSLRRYFERITPSELQELKIK